MAPEGDSAVAGLRTEGAAPGMLGFVTGDIECPTAPATATQGSDGGGAVWAVIDWGGGNGEGVESDDDDDDTGGDTK